MKQCMYQQNTSPEKGCYYENKSHSIMFMDCKTANCYYKQLKRLQAENEELKHKNENLKLALSSYELPEVVKVLTDWRTGELQLKENKLNKLEQGEAKYRKALEEIKEYIQSLNKDICNNCGWHNTDGCSPNGYVCHDLIEIQNKINEVLG